MRARYGVKEVEVFAFLLLCVVVFASIFVIYRFFRSSPRPSGTLLHRRILEYLDYVSMELIQTK